MGDDTRAPLPLQAILCVTGFVSLALIWLTAWSALAVVLTDGSQTRGLIIPVDASGDAIALPGGAYRFTFAIDRVRWRADAPDATSNYRAETTFDVSW